MAEKKKGIGKWIFIIIVVLLLAFTSMIVAGIIGILVGVTASGDDIFQPDNANGNVALIKIHGVIRTESSSGLFDNNGDISSSTIVETLERIKEDNSIKAVIFEINSPGGSGVASDEIGQAIKSLNKTTVAYVRDIGASGAYWIASSTDHIIANRLSFVGSIGVIGSFIEFSGLMKDYNITYQRFVAGEMKDFGSPYIKPNKEASELFQNQIDQVYDVFVSVVAENRNMSVEEVQKIAHGMVYTGMQAKELGLIDEFGGKQEAINYIEQELNITIDIVEYKKEVSLWDILAGVQSKKSYNIGRGIGDSVIKSSTERNMLLA